MKEYSLAELSRSRLLYDRDPPPLMLITAVVIIMLVAGILVWACVTEKTEVVNAAGIVSADGVEYHSSTVAGIISSIEVEEGSLVGAGDPVIRLDTGELEKQLEAHGSLEDLYKTYSDEYAKAISSLRSFDTSSAAGSCESNLNPFDSGDLLHSTYQVYLDRIGRIGSEYPSGTSRTEAVEETINQALAELSSAKTQYDVQYMQSRSQADICRKMIDDSEFRAGSEGIVHIMSGLEVGTAVSSGQVLFTVSPELNEDICTITVYLPSASRAYVSVGDKVNVKFEGIDENEYGAVRGELVSIGADSTRDSAGNVIYECEVRPDSVRFQDRTGKSVEVVQGMTAKVSIHYGQTTWIGWVKHRLGLD